MARFYSCDGLSAIDLISVPCAICQGNNSSEICIDNGFTIRKCENPKCGFVYVNPRPTNQQLAKLYRTYYSADEVVPEKWKREMGAIFRECCDWLIEWQRTGRVLEVGCSFGHFLNKMEGRGWKTVGIEPSPVAVRYAREHITGQIFQSDLENVELEPESFDAVVSLYVLEHVSDPRAFLAKVFDVLHLGGLAIIRTTYVEPLMPIFRIFGQSGMHAPMHLNDFSPHVMRRLALDLGFQNVEVRVGPIRYSHDLIEIAGALILGNLGRILEFLSRGKVLFPWVGALSYRLSK